MFQKRKSVDTKALVSILVLPDGKDVKASQGTSILDALLDSEIEIDHSCGGMGSCGTCRIIVEKGLEKFEPRNEAEIEIAQDRGFEAKERLSCQNAVQDGLVIRRPYST